MKKISIRTSQNIVIDFNIASLGVRILSFFIDLTIIGFTIFFIGLLTLSYIESIIYVLPLIFIFYTPVSEIFMNGQTLGKKLMRIRVVNVNGKEPQTLDFIIRWAFRLVDIFFTLGSLAVIFISTTPRGQRLGGMLSNTMVISLGSELSLSLSGILHLEDRNTYQPRYLEAYRFREDDMLTVKLVLDRFHKYHNAAHEELLEFASQKVAGVLDVPLPGDRVLFLQTVLRDYIVLTRS